MKSKKGQTFSVAIVVLLSLMIFVFAAPIISSFVNVGASQTGSATAFVMKSFLWVILLVFVGFFIRLFSGGGLFG